MAMATMEKNRELVAPPQPAVTVLKNDSAVNKREWKMEVSDRSTSFVNPIRKIVDTMKLEPNPGAPEPMIRLSIGDPTVFGNFPPSETTKEAVIESIRGNKANGYAPSAGFPAAREAIASRYSYSNGKLDKSDVFITSGCSGALDLVFAALAIPGKNILIPAPGFSLYKTLATYHGIETRSYRCLPEKGWEIDLDHVASLVDENTVAMLITNPSNPTGSNFSRSHVTEIMERADALKLPIVADEIYGDLVYGGTEGFTPAASIKSHVPVIAVGGLAKQWLVPGWRLGWVMTYDRFGILGANFKPALNNLTQLILGACTIVQAALPKILASNDEEHDLKMLSQLRASANLCFKGLSRIPGLKPVMPQGAMYLMCGIDMDKFKDISNDRQFTELLVQEQAVFCLPGTPFDAPNFMRIVLTVPPEMMEKAIARIERFCVAHTS